MRYSSVVGSTQYPVSSCESSVTISIYAPKHLAHINRITSRMNFGHRGKELVAECKHPDLLPYNDELVKGCLNEIVFHVDELEHIVDSIEGDKPSLEVRPALLLHEAAIQRNKRCLLAYMNHRTRYIMKNPVILNSITSLSSTQISSSALPSSSLLSDAEFEFLQAYERLRTTDHPYSLNLTRTPRLPPSQTLVQVRVVETLGTVVLAESGVSVHLAEGTLHYLPTRDVQNFLIQGVVELVEGEEAH
jgi:GINS complex subunit 1